MDEERALTGKVAVTAFAFPTFFPMILLAPKTIQGPDIDSKILGILLAVVDQQLGAVDDVLGDPVVDLAVELESNHVLGVAIGGAVDLR